MVDALLQIVRNDTYSPTVRVAAGRAGLEKLRSFRLELVVEQQIAELACTVEERTNGQPSLNQLAKIVAQKATEVADARLLGCPRVAPSVALA